MEHKPYIIYRYNKNIIYMETRTLYNCIDPSTALPRCFLSVTDKQRLDRCSGGPLVQPPAHAQQGLLQVTSRCSGPHPVKFRHSPKVENSQFLGNKVLNHWCCAELSPYIRSDFPLSVSVAAASCPSTAHL